MTQSKAHNSSSSFEVRSFLIIFAIDGYHREQSSIRRHCLNKVEEKGRKMKILHLSHQKVSKSKMREYNMILKDRNLKTRLCKRLKNKWTRHSSYLPNLMVIRSKNNIF